MPPFDDADVVQFQEIYQAAVGEIVSLDEARELLRRVMILYLRASKLARPRAK